VSGRLRRRIRNVAAGHHLVCQRCAGSGVEPVGAPSDEQREQRKATAVLAELQRKAERLREVRAKLSPDVLDAVAEDERLPDSWAAGE
jgi:hypothetical protein